jgi:Uma2 family endonuclease
VKISERLANSVPTKIHPHRIGGWGIPRKEVRIVEQNRFFYPDVMVTCDPRDRETPLFKSHPSLIVEVLSDSTEANDRGDKFAAYRTITSLKEYVVISQTRRQVDCFRRNAEGQWVLYPFENDHTVHFTSADLRLEMNDLYEDVVFSAPASESIEP